MSKSANLSIFVPHEGCPNQCVFCNQSRITGHSDIPTPEAVRDICERYLPQKATDIEIAFFGGSFTAINRDIMVSLLEAAYPFVQNGRAKGIRVSTRPDAIDVAVLTILKRYGVTAIELGAQSIDDNILAVNKRGHTAQQILGAALLIKALRFSLGLQMMVGMYGETDAREGALHTAGQLINIEPDTVRIYPTVVVEDTELCDLYKRGEYQPLTVENAADICAELVTMFEKKGISVIRVGLHSDENFTEHVVAGPFHPAFGEICYSLIMRGMITELFECAGRTDKITVAVNPRDISRAVGHKKSNIEFFKESGIRLDVIGDDGITPGDVVHAEIS